MTLVQYADFIVRHDEIGGGKIDTADSVWYNCIEHK